MSNYYQTLGVGKHASIDDIKKAYRKLAVKYHPDKNKEDPQAENKFKEIGEAYHVLSNPELRNKYDTYGTIDPQKDFSQHPFGGGFGNLHEAIFREFFGDSFFGGGVKAYKVKTGPSVKVTVSVTLQEVAKGVHKTIKFKQPVSCSTCEGEGVINKHTCDLCNGMGSRITGRNGMFFVQQSCPKCFRRGSWFDTKCLDCQGSGYIKRDKEISFKIPAGIHSGTKLRLKGLGGNPRQGSAGDLLVFVVVENHPQLVRKGNDLFHETFVNYSQAVLGDKIKVPSLDNQVVLTIPPGTQPGAVMRVKDKGILGGSLYVKVNLDVPTNPSKEYKKLVKKLSAIPQE